MDFSVVTTFINSIGTFISSNGVLVAWVLVIGGAYFILKKFGVPLP